MLVYTVFVLFLRYLYFKPFLETQKFDKFHAYAGIEHACNIMNVGVGTL